MGQKRRNRVFPYYIIVGVDEKAQTMKILDLNTIQKQLEDRDARVYEENTDLHDIKEIPIPGTAATASRTVEWMKAMMGDTFMTEKKCMVYNHRAHWTNPIHEEYKRKVFLEWEDARIPELEEEDEPEKIEEDLEID